MPLILQKVSRANHLRANMEGVAQIPEVDTCAGAKPISLESTARVRYLHDSHFN